MKNNLIILALLVLIAGGQLYTEYSPTAQDLGSETQKMKEALEEHFDCEIYSYNYELIVWHQTLELELADNSKQTLTEKEASEYLATNFPNFQYIDKFTIN
jgi:hypothetical protein